MANKCWLIPYDRVVFSFCFHSVAYLMPITMGLRWDQATHWKKRQKRKSEPSRAVVWEWEREKMFTSTPPPPLPPQSSPPLRSPTFLAVPPTLVPRVFWLVSQRGDAGTPLGHRQWWEHSSPTNGVDAMWGFSLLLFLSLTPTGFSPDSPVFSSS